MIDLDKLQLFGGKITVKPSDNIFYELGNNTYDFKDLLSELIDNSIAARRLDEMIDAGLVEVRKEVVDGSIMNLYRLKDEQN